MPRKGGKRRKTRTHVVEAPSVEKDDSPMSFVFKMGKVPGVVSTLVQDMRRVMAPYTADKLREKRKNTLKDFVHVGAPMGVTHFIFFTNTEAGTNLKIARIPRGPTLSFKVTKYSLMKQMHLVVKRPVDASQALKSKPLVVLNNFTAPDDHIKLMNVTFQNMFPAIDVQTVALSECRRVVLFNYEKETDTVEFRQYVIRAAPLGLSKSVKTIVKAKVPNLNKLEDISEYVLGNGAGVGSASDSEVDDEASHVTLPDSFRGRGNRKAEKSAVRLTEIGPRLTLSLTKVERGICEGDVLYHAYKTKTPEESAKAKAKHEAALALKRQRREEQEANVAKKQEAKDAKKQRKAERKRKREQGEDDDEYDETTAKTGGNDDDSELDDVEYYRQEVGEEPDAYMFPDKKEPKHKKQKKTAEPKAPAQKPSEVAASDKKNRFIRPGAKAPKGQVIRQRQPKKK
ncbi:SWI4 1, Peter Pan-like protein suppressor [Phytophthora cinnamomi]|uniref:SWI4 1, Peter Pan-like protein suppressor n=1 Tax=Phytophthora cinnamomi TaxID=4785 RepID=UPI003559CBB5|nr:SWI4 1, Peter Pan-like protein suppressor [Phytophthora cinnamomi]